MEFIQYFGAVFTLTNMSILILATIGGLLLGATPGLSPTMAVALLIPFTFKMDPTPSLIMLGAVYTSTVAGGAVSGILINIPGAPANIATIMDGYPMTVKGRATEALHYCFISSFIGGIVGIALLIFFAPPLAQWALKFGPAELFWVAILGITMIASLGEGSVLKGLIAGGFGLWLSTIGYNPVIGEERFVYTDHLTGGIHMIAALIGLFAIPQVLNLLETSKLSKKNRRFVGLRAHSISKSLYYNLSRVKALTIGTIVGSIVGIIPGAGGQIAGLVAYDQTRKLSNNKAAFGQGEPDGIIAAESANNAMVGPSLIPLLTLGIPGSPTAAVLLGGLLIHGLFPGPDLFITHAAITWTFIDSLLMGQVLMMIFGLMISRYSYFVTRIPDHTIAAMITILAIFGTYSIQNNPSDVMVMLALGLFMFFASRVGFSAAPLVLGLILGPLTETNFLLGIMISNDEDPWLYFVNSPIRKILMTLCIASIVYSVYSEKTPKIVKKNKNTKIKVINRLLSRRFFVATMVMLIAGLLFKISYFQKNNEAFLFPEIIAGILLFLSTLYLFREILNLYVNDDFKPINLTHLLPAFIAMIIAVYSLDSIGMYTTSMITLFAIHSGYSPTSPLSKRLLSSLFLTIGFMVFMYILFSMLLGIQTPRGLSI